MNLARNYVVLVGMAMVLTLGLVGLMSMQTASAEQLNMKLVIDTTKLKFQDLNNNTKPDAGEFSSILGTLYATGTQNEIGKYRCFFSFGGWASSTEGVPVTPAVQVFDIKGNGTIVVVGDEPGEGAGAIGKKVDGAIAGGTGSFKGISGTAGLTEKEMEGTNIPVDVMFDIKWP